MSDKHPESTILDYLQLMRVDRPIGTFLLLWPTLWALWIAGKGLPEPTIVLIFIAGTYVMRAAGCIINDLADREFDKHVERTKTRPLAQGVISVQRAISLFFALLILAFILVLQLNALAITVSVAALLVATLYPFAKRVTHLPQLVLGIAFSMGIPMSFAALTNSLPVEMWLLFLANFLWIVAYDTQYAMADRDDDLIAGIKSTAILFGSNDNIIIGLLHLSSLVILGVIGELLHLGWYYYIGLLSAGGFAVYQQHLCRNREPEKCFRAFLNNSWFGAMIFVGIVLSFIHNNLQNS